MSYLTLKDIKPVATAWTEEEITNRLRHILKGRSLLLPDDDWYTKAADDTDLNDQMAKLSSQLGIKIELPTARFFDDIEIDGYLVVDDEPEILINKKHRRNPYKCAAIIAHGLCHLVLIKKRVYFSEASENEKAADLMSIEAGLGVIVLNGSSGAGWRGSISRRARRLFGMAPKGSAFGYFTSAAYSKRFLSYLDEQRAALPVVKAHLLPWVRPLLNPSANPTSRNKPAFINDAEHRHTASLRRFTLGSFLVLASLAFIINVSLRHPAFLSDELRQQRQYVEQLSASYEACIDRVESLRRHRDAGDHFIKRVTEAEITTCKSLQNRYNHEVKAYNDTLRKYD